MKHSYYFKRPEVDSVVRSIGESNFPNKFDSVENYKDRSGANIIVVNFSSKLALDEEALLTNLVASISNSATTEAFIAKKIADAMSFGKQLVIEYGVRNVMARKNTAQIRAISIKLGQVQMMLMSGSLYSALEEMREIAVDDVVSESDKQYFIMKIQKHLGIP